MASGVVIAGIALAAVAAGATAYESNRKRQAAEKQAKQIDRTDPEAAQRLAELKARRQALERQRRLASEGAESTYHSPFATRGVGSAKIEKRKILG
jgi:hypothetical protein